MPLNIALYFSAKASAVMNFSGSAVASGVPSGAFVATASSTGAGAVVLFYESSL